MNKKKLDFSKIKTYPIKKRKNKSSVKDFAKVCDPNPSFADFLKSLPNIFAGNNFIDLVDRIEKAYKNNKPVILMMGAHVIKCGLGPLIIDLMRNGIVKSVALNGAGMIHDFELSMIGETSEEVAVNIQDGSFGMADETGRIINSSLEEGIKNNWGAGKSIAEKIKKEDYKFKDKSLLYSGLEYNVPVTVHIAIGTDIIHQHPTAKGAVLGEASYNDFKTFAEVLTDLEGGVIINLGSAVLLPEVFLKALTIVRNLGYKADNFTAANFDMIRHYRPQVNVLSRPTNKGGCGYNFNGHHEIMIPLLITAIKTKLNI